MNQHDTLTARLDRIASWLRNPANADGCEALELSFAEWCKTVEEAIAALSAAQPAQAARSDGRGTDTQIEKERDIARHAIVGSLASGYAGQAHPGADHWLAAAHEAGARIKALEVQVAQPVQGVPQGWSIKPNHDGFDVRSPSGSMVYVEEEATGDRRMPEEVLHALCKALLTASPTPPAQQGEKA